MMYNLIPVLIIIASLFLIIFLVLRRMPEAKGKVEKEKEEVKEMPKESEEELLKAQEKRIQLKKPFLWRLKKRILQVKAGKEKKKRWFRSLTPPRKPRSYPQPSLKEREKVEKKEVIVASQKTAAARPAFTKRKMVKMEKVVAPLKKGVYLGSQLFKKKRLAKQEIELLEQLDLRPDDYQILKELSQVYIKRKKYEKAAEMLKRLIEVKPTDFYTYGDLGFVSLKLGNYTEAVEAYKMAVDHDPKNVEYLKNLAMIAEKLDNMPMLKATLERLLEIEPDNKKIKVQLKELEKQSKLL